MIIAVMQAVYGFVKLTKPDNFAIFFLNVMIPISYKHILKSFLWKSLLQNAIKFAIKKNRFSKMPFKLNILDLVLKLQL